jgi:hypothetical protein
MSITSTLRPPLYSGGRMANIQMHCGLFTLCSDGLLSTTAALAVQTTLAVEDRVALLVIKVILLVRLEVCVAIAGNPGASVIKGRILARKVETVVASTQVVPAALRQATGASRELRGHGGVGGDPVGESILAVLNNGLASLVSIIGSTRLARGDGSVVDELEEVLAVARNNGDLLAVLAQSIELVGVGGLYLLASDVRKLCLCHKRLGFGTDQLLLENDNLGRVGLLVLEVRDLVGDLLLSCCCVSFAVVLSERYESSYGLGWAERKLRCFGCSSS